MNGDVIVDAAKHGRDWFDYATGALGLLGFLVLCAYTYFTRKQVKVTEDALEVARDSNAAALKESRESNEATRKSNEIATDALVLGNRAWLVLDEDNDEGSIGLPRLNFDVQDDTLSVGCVATVKIKNVGRVPAIIRRYGWDLVGGNGLPEHLILSVTAGNPAAMVVVNDKSELQLTHSRLFTREMLPQIFLDGSDVLYCYWIVEYTDCMKQPWRTTKAWRRDVRGRLAWQEATEPQCSRLE